MLGGGEPCAHSVGKFDRCHARTSQRDNVEESLVMVGEERVNVTGQRGVHERIVFPCGLVGQAAL